MLDRLCNLFASQPSAPGDDYRRRFRTDVFFRTREGFLSGAEIPTKHEDIPNGAPILHYFAYRFEDPWYIDTITMCVYGGGQTASFCKRGETPIEICFAEFDDGWTMNFSKPDSTPETVFREFLTLAVRYLDETDEIYDVRWYHDKFLTCGCLHPGEFEKGALAPFINEA